MLHGKIFGIIADLRGFGDAAHGTTLAGECQFGQEVDIRMKTESTSGKVQQYSDAIIAQFHPIAAQFGFTKPVWDYDPELDIVRVQFENSERGNALQIDYHVEKDSCSANYCRMQGAWQMCIEGKRKSMPALRATLPRWIRRQCEECRIGPELEEAEL